MIMAHHATTTAPTTDLERIYVAADGSVKALYTDNSLLLLSSSAASFTRVSAAADGAKTVQLTECCLTRWKPLLAELLAFRNTYLDVPCFPGWLQQQLDSEQDAGLLFSTRHPITDTTWPASAEAAVEAGLVRLVQDGAQTIQLFSSCGAAYITLSHRGSLRFAVCYPLLLRHDAASNTYTYTQHTQVFSRSQHPARWRHALAVAVAAAGLAAASSSATPCEEEPQQLQLLQDVTNRLSLQSPRSCSPARHRHSCSGAGAAHAAGGGEAAAAGSGCSSPVQRQHRPWQDADSSSPAQESGLSASSPSRMPAHLRPWCPPGSPGSPTAALYAVAEQHQQQQQQLFSTPAAAVAARRTSSSSSLDCVVQLPIPHQVLQSLPAHIRQQQQQRRRRQSASQGGQDEHAHSSSSGGWNSHIASALAEALGQRQQGGSSGYSSGCVGSWWLEPHLRLPTDELLHIMWSPAATFVFVEDTCEVEVWLHADDSCLFSFQSGAFLTHLQPHAAAAEGCVDGSSSHVSRVYAASALPVELTVPSLAADGSRTAVMLPLGGLAAEALRLRSTMARVKASLAASARAAHPGGSSSSTTTSSSRALLPQPHGQAAAAAQFSCLQPPHQQQQQQQQQQTSLSLDVLEEQEVAGVGRFTAYADGRVRVLFADRTILQLDAARQLARLIMPDGSSREVPVSRAFGVEEYVQAALEFAAWSSHSPIQRAAALRMQALVAAELRSSARMAAICEWGSNPAQLPAAAASASAAGPAAVSWALAGGEAPLLLTAGTAECDPPSSSMGDCQSVEELLRANRKLLDRL